MRLAIDELTEHEWVKQLARVDRYSFFATPDYFRTWITHFAPDARVLAARVETADGFLMFPFVETLVSRKLGLRARSAAPEWGYGMCGSYRGKLDLDAAKSLVKELTGLHIESCFIVSDPLMSVDLSALSLCGMQSEMLTAAILDLEGDYGAWYGEVIDKKIRRQIVKSAQQGLVTRRCGVEALDVFYSLYQASVEITGRKKIYPKDFLHDLLLQRRAGSARLYLTFLGDTCVAGGLLLCGKRIAIAWIGAMRREFAHLNGNTHRHAAVIRDLYSEGFACYNLGASPGLPGVEQYKQKFGASVRPYWVYSWSNPASRAFRRLQRMLQH